MNIFFIIIGLLYLIYVILRVRKGSFSIVESFFWVIAGIVVLILAIFPDLIKWLSSLVGIDYAPSLLFMICSIFLLFINFRNSKKIADQQEKIIELAQRVAILQEKNRKR